MKEKVNALFTEIYGYTPAHTAFAPGRVNLIGEHTDYNGGRVFPCALSMGITCAFAPREDSAIRFYSADFADDGIIECALDDIHMDNRWADYPKAVLATLARFGYPLAQGADLLFAGNLPDGAGLSSSAALEVLTATVANTLGDFSLSPQLCALFGQFAENRFIGVNCGIMDQFASAMGKRGNAILLDTNQMSYAYAPIPDSCTLVIINSGVKHSLASSAYNDRRRECETALKMLQSAVKAPTLCSLTPEEFERFKDNITDPVIYKRAKHAVYENTRTLQAAQALQSGNIHTFGRLMNESHRSLQYDYEVSCEELDLLAAEAQQQAGVYGSRMTGGGFGGCTVTLVDTSQAEAFVAHMTKFYENTFRRKAKIYTAEIVDGAKLL